MLRLIAWLTVIAQPWHRVASYVSSPHGSPEQADGTKKALRKRGNCRNLTSRRLMALAGGACLGPGKSTLDSMQWHPRGPAEKCLGEGDDEGEGFRLRGTGTRVSQGNLASSGQESVRVSGSTLEGLAGSLKEKCRGNRKK